MHNRCSILSHRHWIALVVGPVIGLATLYGAFAHQRTDFERFNINPNQYPHNPFNPEYQCQDMRDASECISHIVSRGERQTVLWLGNSQLNTVSFYMPGEKTAVNLVHDRLIKHGTDVFGINAYSENIREQFILYSFAISRSRVDDLILPIVYPLADLTVVRPTIASALLDPPVASILKADPTGREMLDTYTPRDPTSHKIMVHNAISGSGQQSAAYEVLEDGLNSWLNHSLELFSLRGEARGQWYVGLLRLRNWVLSQASADPRLEAIGNSTARPDYPRVYLNMPGYQRNFQLLSRFIDFAAGHGTRVHIYWAPVPQQLFERTDTSIYRSAKEETIALANAKGVDFSDFESLIPDDRWSVMTRGKDWVLLDLYHFRESGHVALANAVVDMLAGSEKRSP